MNLIYSKSFSNLQEQMTKRQKELLDFIRVYVKKNEMSPTYREMSNALKNKSISNIIYIKSFEIIYIRPPDCKIVCNSFECSIPSTVQSIIRSQALSAGRMASYPFIA